jgi:hypothetical protein
MFALSAQAYPIYKYVDDEGTVAYTDQHQLIPERYRERVTVVNPETLSSVQAGSEELRSTPPSRTPMKVTSRWRVETFSMPLLRFAAGIILLLLFVKLTRRYAARPLASAGFVRTVAILIAIGSLYDLYLEQKFALTEDETTGWHIKTAVSRKLSHLSTEAMRAMDRPLKPVRRVVDKANEAAAKEAEELRKITAEPADVPQ